jgi:RNA polymerase sigma-70 factor (ECF subfamily)
VKGLQSNYVRGADMNEKEIIDLFWERSEIAISETSKKYGSYCYSIAYNILSNDSDAQECINDAYLAAWNSIPPTRPNIFKTFLGRLTRNISLDRYDYNTAKKRKSDFDILLSELEDCIFSAADTEKEYYNGQVSKMISNFLRTIDKEQRTIFIRRYWYSDSIKDISALFGLSDSKVKSMLFRTRSKLKLYLEEEGVVL